MTKTIKVVTIFLLLLIVTPMTVNAQNSVNDVKNEEADTQQDLDKSQADLEEANSEYDDTVKKLQDTSDEIKKTKNKITETKNEISKSEDKIKDLEENQIPAMEDKAEASLKFSQKNMNSNILLNMVLGSLDDDDQTSSLEEKKASEELSEATNESLDKLATALQEVESQKNSLKSNKTALEQEQSDLKDQEADFKEVQSDLSAQIGELEGDTDYAQAELESQKATEKLYKDAGCKEDDVYGVDCGVEEIPDATPTSSSNSSSSNSSSSNSTTSSSSNSLSSNSQATTTSTSNSGGMSSLTGDGAFIRPLDHATVTQNFGDMNYETGDTHGHTGMDLAAAEGTPVHATASGKVLQTGYANDGGGNSVVILHVVDGQNYISRYAHLSSISVSPGQNVKQGQTVGAVGHTGTAYGSHLHFEMEQGSTYNWSALEDPRTYINFPPKGSSW